MIKISKLKNGIRIVTEQIPGVQTVSLGVWVGVGSRYEKKQENGISHFLEHMAFKGTTTRSALDIVQEIENVGGVMNAYTGKDMTGYYVHLLKENLSIALDIISDILQHATMDPKELNTEKGVIIQELNMYKDQPDFVVEKNFEETAYPNQPFGRDVGGDADVIRLMTPKKMLAYMHQKYTADKMVISASGAVEHQKFVKDCQKLFKDVSTHKGVVCVPAKYKGGYSYVTKPHEQINLLVGFEGECHTSPDYWRSKVLSIILGGGMTSRLFQEIREKRGLVYAIRASADSDSDTGLFSIYAGTGPKEIKELMPVLCDELLRVSDTITMEELIRVKTQIKAQLMMQSEKVAAHAERNAHQMLHYGHLISNKEILSAIQKVTIKDLGVYARKLFSQKPTVAALGPIKNLMKYDDICRRLKA